MINGSRDFGDICARLVLVYVLQADVVGRLSLHVREAAGERKDVVLVVEYGHSVCDNPEVWRLESASVSPGTATRKGDECKPLP